MRECFAFCKKKKERPWEDGKADRKFAQKARANFEYIKYCRVAPATPQSIKSSEIRMHIPKMRVCYEHFCRNVRTKHPYAP